MNLSVITFYFLLLRMYPVKSTKDTDLVIHKSSYKNKLYDNISVAGYDVNHRKISNKVSIRRPVYDPDLTNAKIEQVNHKVAKRVKNKGPSFVKEMKNVTVAVGWEASIDCHVSDAEDYKVAWIYVDTATVLSYNDVLITRNNRVSVKKEQGEYTKTIQNIQNWKLVIDDVMKKDEGFYQCQLNTDPTKAKNVYLEVTTQPEINDRGTSRDMTVREGENIELRCRAEGHPTPRIEWKREDGKPIRRQESGSGTSISIPNVSRHDAGAFLCIASNNVPPTVSRRITVTVLYEPDVHMSGKVEKVTTGDRVHLNCTVNGIPKPDISWWRNQKKIETGDNTHLTRNKLSTESTVVSSLEIVYLKHTDDSVIYACAGNNSEGRMRDSIEIKITEAIKYNVPRNEKTQRGLRNDYGLIEENVEAEHDQLIKEGNRKTSFWNITHKVPKLDDLMKRRKGYEEYVRKTIEVDPNGRGINKASKTSPFLFSSMLSASFSKLYVFQFLAVKFIFSLYI